MANLWRQAQNRNVRLGSSYELLNTYNMAVIYINGIPIGGVDYASPSRYFSPQDRRAYDRDIEDVEYEDLTENDNENGNENEHTD